MEGVGFLPVINKGNDHETFNDCIGGSAGALQYLRAGPEQRWRCGRRHVRRDLGRFFGNRRNFRCRLIGERVFDGEPAGLDRWPHKRFQHEREPVGEYAAAERFAQRFDVDADRTGFRPQQISDASAMNEKPRLRAGLFCALTPSPPRCGMWPPGCAAPQAWRDR
jgi:hypothetical protein